MEKNPTLTLADLIPGWPNGGPEDLAELQFVTDEQLNGFSEESADLVRTLRTQVRRAALTWGRSAQLHSPEAIERCLGEGDLRLLSKRWLTLALDKNRRRSFTPFSADSARTVEKLSRFVPEASELPTLPPDGTYLVLYGGGPEVLQIPDVRERLIRLQEAVPVADVLFRLLETGPRSTLFSLRQGFGVHSRSRVEFPDPELVTQTARWT